MIVDALVQLESRGPGELGFAEWEVADVWLQASVSLLMGLKVPLSDEGNVALLTLEWLLASMCAHVRLQVT